MGKLNTSYHFQINIRLENLSQEPPVSSKCPYQDLKDMDILCIFKIKIESQNSEYGWNKDQLPYPNQYQGAKPQSGTSNILQRPKSGLKGHGHSLHLWSQDRESIFVTWVYQKPVNISKSWSRCQISVRNLQRPPKPQIRTLRAWMFFAPSKSR